MVELRIDAIEDENMPKDCFISVRVGDTQKLSRLSGQRVYRFPQAGDRRYGKIEVFRRIGACSIDVDPLNENMRQVEISCKDSGFGSLGLKVAVEADPVGKKKLEEVDVKQRGTKVKAAKEYLSKHGIEVRLSECMQAVLRERPEDPFDFIATKLYGESAGGLKLPPVKGTQQKESSAKASGFYFEAQPPKQSPVKDAGPPPPPVPARPQKLEPLTQTHGTTSEHKAQAAATCRSCGNTGKDFMGNQCTCEFGTKAVAPAALPKPPDFRSIDGAAFAKMYAKFPSKVPKASVQALAPVQAPASTSDVPGFAFKPSVGTWLATPPRRPVVEQALAPGSAVPGFVFKPSVGTWLATPPRIAQGAPIVRAAPAPPAEQVKSAFNFKPSVGTWLAPIIVEPEVKSPFKFKPSVGTWLAPIIVEPEVAPVLAAKNTAQKAEMVFSQRPSVGTWLSPLLRASDEEDKIAPAVPVAAPRSAKGYMLMSNKMLGPSFSSMGIRPGVMMI